MEDGRLNVLTRGTRPFRIVAEQDDLPYPAATVEFLEDKAEEPDEDAAEAARDAYAELVAQATDNEPDDDEIAAKTRLRDGGDRRLRPRRQAGPARPALGERPPAAGDPPVQGGDKRLDFVERAQARARSNGKVRFG